MRARISDRPYARRPVFIPGRIVPLPYLSHCDGLQYIRINALGTFVMGHTDDYVDVAQEGKNDVYAFDGTDLVFYDGAFIVMPATWRLSLLSG